MYMANRIVQRNYIQLLKPSEVIAQFVQYYAIINVTMPNQFLKFGIKGHINIITNWKSLKI